MVGVQDERHVHGADGHWILLRAKEHVEEVGGQAQVGPWGQRLASLAQCLERGHDGGRLRDQAHRLAHAGLARVIRVVGVVHGEQGHRCAEHLHGHRRPGELGHHAQHIGRQRTVPGQLRPRLLQFAPRG